MKKLICCILIVICMITPAGAAGIEGNTTAERAVTAGYDLMDYLIFLSEYYAGGTVTVEELYEAALRGLAEILDEYSAVLTEDELKLFSDDLSGIYEGIGIIVAGGSNDFVFIKEVFENSPAQKAGLRVKDVITNINGYDVSDLLPYEISELIAAAPRTFQIEVLRGGAKKRVTVTKGEIITNTARTMPIKDLLPGVSNNQNEKIGYINITTFGNNTASDFAASLDKLKQQNTEYLVLDLRSNSGGDVGIMAEITELIVPAGKVYSVKYATGEEETLYSGLEKPYFKHIAVLTDQETASASEILASALQDSKMGTVIGQTTYGKGCIQLVFPTLTDGAFLITVATNHRRNGNPLHKKGVTPNIAVPYPEFIDEHASSETDARRISGSIKKALAYIGYKPGKGTGYDSVTKREIMKFQKEHNLPETGIPDEETCLMLNIAQLDKYFEKDYELECAVQFFAETYNIK